MRSRILSLSLAALLVACDSTSPPQVATITIVTPGVTLTAIGATLQAVATATTEGGGTVNISEFTWTSSNDAVATVTSAGLVTAAGNGTATVSAAARGVTGTAVITVAQAVSTIAITPGTVPNLAALGATTVLTATASDANANAISGVTFSWASTSLGIASVNSGGLVTAVANGTATISATASGVTATRSVTVAQVVTSVIAASTAIGFNAKTATASLSAVARDNQSAIVASAPLTWTSTAPSVATVSGSGLVTAVANGNTLIIVSSGTPRDTVSVNVTQVSNNILLTCVSYASLTKIGSTRQCSATIRDRLNQTMTGTVTWSSANTNILTVNSAGLVTAVNNGLTQVYADGLGQFAAQSLDVDLEIGFGEVVTGNINVSTGGHGYDVVGSQTRVNFLAWMHRTPLTSSSLDPQVTFSQTASGVNTTRTSGEIGRLTTYAGQLFARVDIPFSGTNTDVIAYSSGGATGGNYAMGVADCFNPNAALSVGYYSAGRVASGDCAVLWRTANGTADLAPGVISKFDFIAGQVATIEVISGCTSGAVSVGCTGAGIGDPVIYVFGPNAGQLWYSDDDISGTNDSRVVLNTVPTTGAYSVVIVGYNGATGSFTICAFSNCAGGALGQQGIREAGSEPGSAIAKTPVPMMSRDGWTSNLTVEKAERLLKAAGIATSEGRLAVPKKKQ